jgi:hypothetical protein
VNREFKNSAHAPPKPRRRHDKKLEEHTQWMQGKTEAKLSSTSKSFRSKLEDEPHAKGEGKRLLTFLYHKKVSKMKYNKAGSLGNDR